MSLYTQLQTAKSEEDFKDGYIKALGDISAYIGTYFVSFKISTHEDEFISTVKATIRSGGNSPDRQAAPAGVQFGFFALTH